MAAIRRVRFLLTVAVAVAMTVTPAQAVTGTVTPPANGVIYTDTGLDPANDGATGLFDIRRTSRTYLWRDGVRFLRIAVRSGDDFSPGGYLDVVAALDTRGGPRADVRIVFRLRDMEAPPGCGGDLRFRLNGAMTCLIKARDLRPDKRIRWRVTSKSVDGEVHDRAPGRGGWYQ